MRVHFFLIGVIGVTALACGSGSEPVPDVPTDALRLATVAAGPALTCGTNEIGVAYCWGANDALQATGVEGQQALRPTRVEVAPEAVISLAMADTTTCALTGSGQVYCWGDNTDGRLGTGELGVLGGAAAVRDLDDVNQLSAGKGHFCALTGGEIWCWGSNDFGQLGDASQEVQPAPNYVPGLSGVAEVAAGGYRTCSRLRDGRVSCWGALGNGPKAAVLQPRPIAGLRKVGALRVGAAHVCALETDGSVACWGSNADGQLGVPEVGTHSDAPVRPLTEGAKLLAVGDRTTCASTDDTLFCWGYPPGGGAPITAPQAVAGVPALKALAIGDGHACGIGPSDEAYCWGANDAGQLGTGDTKASPEPAVLDAI